MHDAFVGETTLRSSGKKIVDEKFNEVILDYAPLDMEISKYLYMDQSAMSMYIGRTHTLSVTDRIGAVVDNSAITWNSSDSSIAKVENGVITALKPGTVTITGSKYGYNVTKQVTVQSPITYVELNKESEYVPYVLGREFGDADVIPMGKAFPNEKVFLF